MDNRNNISIEERHDKAYIRLKEIQLKFGFDHIAHLRSIYDELTPLFRDFDREPEPTTMEEFEDLMNEVFSFFSKYDQFEDSEIQNRYLALEEKFKKCTLPRSLTWSIEKFYIERINSDIEKLRRQIIKKERKLEKSINKFYSQEWEKRINIRHESFTLAIIEALKFAFGFPTNETNWTTDLTKYLEDCEYRIPEIRRKLKKAGVPKRIIQEFTSQADKLERYKRMNKDHCTRIRRF